MSQSSALYSFAGQNHSGALVSVHPGAVKCSISVWFVFHISAVVSASARILNTIIVFDV